MKKIIIIFSLIFLYIINANAGVVPGTIQKGEYTTSIDCIDRGKTYYPTGGYCYTSGCDRWNSGSGPVCGSCLSYQQLPNYCTWQCGTYPCSGTGCTPSPKYCSGYNASKCGTHNGSCISWPSCEHSSFGCADYKYWPATNGSITFYDKTRNEAYPNFGQSGYNVKLTNDISQTCTKKAWGTNHTPPSRSGVVSCEYGSSSYYVGGSNGVCNGHESKDNLITYFDQLGNINRNYPNDSDSTCTVEGRYATADNTAPQASINLTKVFQSDENKWCNIKKYRGEWGQTYKQTNPGCEFYKSKNPNISGQEDLLKGLEITVPSDPSGIGSVEIQLGTCNYTYTPDNSNLSNIIKSNNSPDGVKDIYKNGFVIKYDDTVNALGKNQPSLLSALLKDRLDRCLGEGKNYLSIIIKDMAVSEADGKTPKPNTGKKYTIGSINIDNSDPILGISGDLADTSNIWRNYTLKGNITVGERYASGKKDDCGNLTTGTGKCNLNKSGGRIYISPTGVDPNTGIFTNFKCGDLGPFPNEEECEVGCPNGKEWNGTNCVNTNVNTNNICKAIVGGTEVIIKNGENGVVNRNNTCMPYCIPGHSVGCIVKHSTYCIPGHSVGCIVKHSTR